MNPALNTRRSPTPSKVRFKARAARLRALGEAAFARSLAAHVGTRARVLVENEGLGYSEHFLPVAVDGACEGDLVELRLSGVADGRLR